MTRGSSLQMRTDCFAHKEDKNRTKRGTVLSPPALLFSSAGERNRFHGVSRGREAAANASVQEICDFFPVLPEVGNVLQLEPAPPHLAPSTHPSFCSH